MRQGLCGRKEGGALHAVVLRRGCTSGVLQWDGGGGSGPRFVIERWGCAGVARVQRVTAALIRGECGGFGVGAWDRSSIQSLMVPYSPPL